MSDDLDRRRDELQLIRGLSADLDKQVVGVVSADLLVFGKIVEDLLDRQEVGQWPSPSLQPRMSWNGDDIDLVVVLNASRGLDLCFVKQATLLGRDLFAPRAKAL